MKLNHRDRLTKEFLVGLPVAIRAKLMSGNHDFIMV